MPRMTKGKKGLFVDLTVCVLRKPPSPLYQGGTSEGDDKKKKKKSFV